MRINPWYLKFTALYIALIPFINWAVGVVPLSDMPDGSKFSPMYFIVGLVFVVRDFSQREIGSKGFFVAFGIAAILTFILAHPALAIASLAAFAVGELIDWAVYTFTKRPLSQRILLSSIASVPVDTAIVLVGLNQAMPGMLGWNSFALMVACKLVGAIIVAWLVRKRAV